jgi:hypothetical protein
MSEARVPRVFVPQVFERYSEEKKRFEPVHDLSSAAQFGQLTPILKPTDNAIYLAHLVDRIREALKDFDPERDSFLAIGDPSLIAVCSGLIFLRRRKFRMLKWDKRMAMYLMLEINP